MFWLSTLVVSLAVVLVKLGAYSVWVGILSAGLKFALMALATLAILFAWKGLSRVAKE